MEPLLSALLILAACAAYGFIHSWSASLSFKQHTRVWFGVNTVERYYRFIYNVFSVITFLPVLALVAVLPDHRLYQIPFPWVILTLFVQGSAVIVLLNGLHQTGLLEFLGLQQIFEPDLEKNDHLITSGLYRWVRHPLYTAALVFIWLSPVMTLNLFVFYIGLSVYLIVGARYEERKLLHLYGEPYRRYSQTTPMLIPRPPKDDFRV